MQNVFVLSHASDIDGVGSAALIKKKYGIPSSRLFFSDYSKEGLEYVNKGLSSFYKKGITLYICDLGVNDSILASYLKILEGVKRYGGKIYWFDHHPWSERAIKTLAKMCEAAIIGENKRYCATEITYRKLGFNDAFTKKFVRLVHYSDFNITPPSKTDFKTIGYYAISITSYNTTRSWNFITKRLRHIADVISEGRLFDAKIKNDAEKFSRVNEARVKGMLKELEIRKDFAVGFSKHVQSTYGCMAVIEKSRKPIGIYVNTEIGRGHIRSTDPDITSLARSMGGGGHPRASGFNVSLKKFNSFRAKKDRARFADFVQKKITRLKIL